MRILKRGSTGPDVAEVQTRLAALGFDPGPADGVFGARTEAAVIQFQKSRGLTPDGIVGPRTHNALFGSQPDPNYFLHTIQFGDTFHKLAQTYGVSVSSISAANPGVDPNSLQVGQKIKIPQPGSAVFRVAGWIPYWKQSEAMAVIRNNADLWNTLSPFWYDLTLTGDLSLLTNAEDPAVMQFAREQGIEIIPLITNNYNSDLVSTVLTNETIRHHHINSIVNKVTQMRYDGIEIDYENVYPSDKDDFVLFLRELKAALAPLNKKLIATILAKTSSAGTTTATAGHDYPGIGANVDIVRLMLYDYSWLTPGSIAPAAWVRQVLEYAVTVIPRSKLEAGLPTYGYDWGQERRSISYNEAIWTAQQQQARIISDPQNGPHFTYRDSNGQNHEVWFTNALNFATLMDLAKEFKLRGISVWHPGEDDPRIYTVIRTKK